MKKTSILSKRNHQLDGKARHTLQSLLVHGERVITSQLQHDIQLSWNFTEFQVYMRWNSPHFPRVVLVALWTVFLFSFARVFCFFFFLNSMLINVIITDSGNGFKQLLRNTPEIPVLCFNFQHLRSFIWRMKWALIKLIEALWISNFIIQHYVAGTKLLSVDCFISSHYAVLSYVTGKILFNPY